MEGFSFRPLLIKTIKVMLSFFIGVLLSLNVITIEEVPNLSKEEVKEKIDSNVKEVEDKIDSNIKEVEESVEAIVEQERVVYPNEWL